MFSSGFINIRHNNIYFLEVTKNKYLYGIKKIVRQRILDFREICVTSVALNSHRTLQFEGNLNTILEINTKFFCAR